MAGARGWGAFQQAFPAAWRGELPLLGARRLARASYPLLRVGGRWYYAGPAVRTDNPAAFNQGHSAKVQPPAFIFSL